MAPLTPCYSLTPRHRTKLALYFWGWMGGGHIPISRFLSREKYSRESFIRLQIFTEHLLIQGVGLGSEDAVMIKTKFPSAQFHMNGRQTTKNKL